MAVEMKDLLPYLTAALALGGVMVGYFRGQNALIDKMNTSDKDLRETIQKSEKAMTSQMHDLVLAMKDIGFSVEKLSTKVDGLREQALTQDARIRAIELSTARSSQRPPEEQTVLMGVR